MYFKSLISTIIKYILSKLKIGMEFYNLKW